MRFTKTPKGPRPHHGLVDMNATNGLEDEMAKYECEVCGWIYDPAIGDPDGGIDPGTAFEAIPDDWVCPVCGATKDMFVMIKE